MEEGKKRKEERKDEGKECKQKRMEGTKKEGSGMKERRGERKEREERFHLRKHSHHNMDDSGA